VGGDRPEPDAGGPEPERPFYGRFGWAYDLLVDDPVEPWVDAVERVLPNRPARILDAGCGTGRHAEGLAGRGHELVLADASGTLLSQAMEQLPTAEVHLGDLAHLRLDTPVDAVTCRGVLNDVVEDDAREAVLGSLARALRPGGILVADVRELEATAARYPEPLTRTKTVGELTFTADIRLEDGLLRVHERHERAGDVAEHDLTMRPWTREELRRRLANAGFTSVTFAPGVPAERRDRLLVIARREA
jgi:SAM-dependent methyltransferase